MASTRPPATETADGVAGWEAALAAELAEIDANSLRRRIETPESGQEPRVQLGGQTLLHFTSNNYLGLATDAHLTEAAIEATRRYGTSASASRLLCGSTPLHEQLEARLARLKSRERCLLFSSGYLANLGVISALAGPGDVVFSDALNHASIIDGCRLSRAGVAVYRHVDLDYLETLIRRTPARRRLIVSETVFSMDGDLAPLPDLVELAARHDALLILDEAHATGVLGAGGAGALEQLGVADASAVVVGTLSKALGSVGGFVAADGPVVDYLINRSRPFIFNTALPPAAVAAALAALDIVAAEPERRARLQQLSTRLRDGLASAGFETGPSETQIVPMIVGDADDALAMERRLRDAGVLAKAVRPPTVPAGSSRIRFNVMATHEPADIDVVLDAVT